ncbi:hypothetical protein ACFVZJ_02325 [Streptomyces sp. NPDC058322]|uniref:hypothetical protein n=1 Tax=unclassified Streptomyces TaxID=2593676 RepID=UPI0036E20227
MKSPSALSTARSLQGVSVRRRVEGGGDVAGGEVEALVAALPALKHLAELESQDREGPKQ